MMRSIRRLQGSLVLGTLLVTSWAGDAPGMGASKPSAAAALKLLPVQRDVQVDQPTSEMAARCTIEARHLGDHLGWVVEDPNGVMLRAFVDTDGDNVVDQWCYFRDGMEVYRDIDSDFNGKADQYRWFHTAGSRWAVDRNEDGRIDAWKAISAEEVTAEVVAALATKDVARFARLVLTPTELKGLGLGAERSKRLAGKIAGIDKRFEDLVARQSAVGPGTRWVQFSGSRPGIVPAGTAGSTKDLRVYENVVAICKSGGNHGQIQIGTLVEVGDVWRVIDLPLPIGEGQEVALGGFFFQGPSAQRPEGASGAPSERFQGLMAELEKIEGKIGQAGSPEERARLNAERADLHQQLAEAAATPEDRALWIRQLADSVSAEAQSGGFPKGPERLQKLVEALKNRPEDKALTAYVLFRQLTAQYAIAMQAAGPADFPKVQADWLENLEDFITSYPGSDDTSEAMLQLAISHEFAGQEDEAKKWYGRIVREFPGTPAATKATGARTRLDSVGKTIQLKGRGTDGSLIDLAQYRGRVVLIQYWATWCNPCKADMAALKDLLRKYGSSKLGIIGVNLDTSLSEAKSFLASHGFSWPQIHEDGGLDSRPANEMGILTLPTTILVDPTGKVVNRNVQVAELERELEGLIR